jgi:uncharacterized protein YggE
VLAPAEAPVSLQENQPPVALLLYGYASSANIKTIDYSVGPVYQYPSNGGIPTIAGYTASLTVEPRWAT